MPHWHWSDCMCVWVCVIYNCHLSGWQVGFVSRLISFLMKFCETESSTTFILLPPPRPPHLPAICSGLFDVQLVTRCPRTQDSFSLWQLINCSIFWCSVCQFAAVLPIPQIKTISIFSDPIKGKGGRQREYTRWIPLWALCEYFQAVLLYVLTESAEYILNYVHMYLFDVQIIKIRT